MRNLFFILVIFCFGTSASQNLYTNEPDLVFPILEEFIAENHKNGKKTFDRINRIDSILVVDLDYPLYGIHIKTGSRHTIMIHRWLINEPRRFERTLKHELGHVFRQPHIDILHGTDNFLEIMSNEHWEELRFYYEDPKIWKRINENYYKSLALTP